MHRIAVYPGPRGHLRLPLALSIQGHLSGPVVSSSSLHLNLDMPAPTTETQSGPSTVRLTDSLDKTQAPSSADPEAVDATAIPPSHNARTIVLCFDGTRDQFVTVQYLPILVVSSTETSLAEFEHRTALLDAQEGR